MEKQPKQQNATPQQMYSISNGHEARTHHEPKSNAHYARSNTSVN